ncbi:MAG: hypothetical protein HGA44_22855, partial [Cellulomonadaceae bacterium]|nr:hypothetical protein [Cellulomonadaceae bacterium]
MLRALVMPLPARARVRRPGRPGQSSSLARVVSGVVATALALVGAVALAPVAQAAGTPDVAITVGAPTSALRGSTVPVTLTATNPGGPAGYNASFRMVLPVGASLNPPTQTGARTIAQADGSTVVLWDNVSDLLTGTTSSVTAQVSTGTLPLGPLTISGGAYVNTNPRLVPSFTALGAPNAGSSTGSATGTATIEVVPFTLTTDVAAPENELVRGVHDHRTTVELTIDNNYVGPSSAFTVTEYVPATLEFLGCGATAADGDSSAPGEEYPGSGRLNETDAALPGSCPVPSSVSTALVDPPGTQPLAVYTVVTWDNAALAAVGAGSLATGASKKIYYVVGVPQNANALFGGTAPTAASGDQGSNLDNNTGASTLETGEQQATTTAILSGSYLGTTYTDDGTDTVTLEDLAIQKSADHPVIVQGDASRWTLSIEVSEYTSA